MDDRRTDSAEIEAECWRARNLYFSGEDEAAESILRRVIDSCPSSDLAWQFLGWVRLMRGDYREGWRAHEMRIDRVRSPARGLSYPEWEGAPLCGRSILVCGEGGRGDEIMFVRFVHELRHLGASHITLACNQDNVRLFESMGCADLVVSRTSGQVEVPKHNCWVMLASLPHRLGVTLDVLDGAPYLGRKQIGGSGVAIVEHGNPQFFNDANRSIHTGALREAFSGAGTLEPVGDMLDSAAQVASLDLLVTVDTSWAHLAGALGVPCRVLLPAQAQDWRWLRGRTDSPWYDSIRLFRQPAPGDWASVVANLTSS